MKAYECSSKGDKRFSALYARIKGRGNRSIEDIYQVDIKGYASLKEGKGKRGRLHPMQVQEKLYTDLWIEYLEENPDLLDELVALHDDGYTFTDCFAGYKAANQASSLTKIVLMYKEITKYRKEDK